MKATDLAIAALTRSYGFLEKALDGLSVEHLYYMPTPTANSIAWLVWHLSRWKDNNTARLSNIQSLWESQGWASRFNMATNSAGMGDTSEDVAAFRPNRELLFDYALAAQSAALERISLITPADLKRNVETPWGPRPGSLILTATLNDSLQHIGQIAYLRGMITGRGWLPN